MSISARRIVSFTYLRAIVCWDMVRRRTDVDPSLLRRIGTQLPHEVLAVENDNLHDNAQAASRALSV